MKNIEDMLNMISIQEQVLEMNIRLRVLEKMVIEKTGINVDKYNAELKAAAELVAENFKKAYENVDKLQSVMKSLKEEKAEEKTEEKAEEKAEDGGVCVI